MEQVKERRFLDPLNALICLESLIVDIFFRNTEVLGALKTDRKAIFI
ncbi:MAG: hypothetical protein P0Y53_09200 [Candidatus Pseudobacter hemicellulosilyticus]|uniref:Uncharacterized protein n=1 Tax=Candidatus Pseudobacter hemicellulosilyticus TaxID=3121375 RepID=A0AAJ5WW30_9BACT|nr:MAG: hypothetical protein P0Y53_09200 [Pseudobacter sp.]